MSIHLKATAVWLVLLVAMVGNGIVRVLVWQPWLGEAAGRQVASLLGIGVVGVVAALFVRRLEAPRPATLAGIGVLWLALTVAFEFLFGRYVAGASWEALLADYDVGEGRLWPFVLLATLLAPWLCARALQGVSPRRHERGDPRRSL